MISTVKLNQSIYVIIPAYNPDDSLLDLIEQIAQRSIRNVIVINDGTDEIHKEIFKKIEKSYPHIILINHENNYGKGAALKTGFRYVIDHSKGVVGVVTADADGQHHIDDVMRVAEHMVISHNTLVIGARSFNHITPWRSRIGNYLTRIIFFLVSGQRLSDTQSGLRGIPINFIKYLISSTSNRYDFELEMLLKSHKYGTPIKQIPIQTIYINQNKTSHFRPITDSIKIYLVFLKYILVALLSFGLDYGMFLLTISLFKTQPWVAHILVRIFSSLFNFFMNRIYVFKSKGHIGFEYFKYVFTALYVLVFSTSFLYLLYNTFSLSPAIAKLVADGMTFLLSFIILRVWVFRKKE